MGSASNTRLSGAAADPRFAMAGKLLFASSELQRATLLLSALTIHKIPEGFAALTGLVEPLL
jgi:zinc transporter ZupT